MDAKKYYIERHIPGQEIHPVEFVDAGSVFHYEDMEAKYIPYETRFAPDFALFCYGENGKPVRMGKKLDEVIAHEIRQIKKEQVVMVGRGLPGQQFIFQAGDQELTLSNYNVSLSDDQRDEIQRWVGTMVSRVVDGLGMVKNIFIVPDVPDVLPTGEPMNGESPGGFDGIVLYPPALSPRRHRTGEVSNLTGTLTHEFFHQYNRHVGVTDLSQKCNKIGDWNIHYKFPKMIAGRLAFSTQENLIETAYGKVAPTEEFCDAAVKAIYNRSAFHDVKKRSFIDKHFLSFDRSLEVPFVRVARVESVQYPVFPGRAHFTISRILRST